MRVRSIHVGRPRHVTHRGRPVTTAIFKDEVAGPILLRTLDLDGDEQADLSVHGGPDKAVYAYGLDAYESWRKLRPGTTFAGGAMGENLSVDVLPEGEIFVGDTFRIGAAVVQVSQPRFPCYKLGVKFDDARILKQFMALERPGVYFRVLQEGLISAGNELDLLEREPVRVSVLELFRLQSGGDVDEARLQEMLLVKGLTRQWRHEIEEALARPG